MIETGARRVIAQGVDPNTAQWFELAQLPGIGETLSKRVVDYREKRAKQVSDHAAFSTSADLRQVKGFGGATLLRIGPYLSFSPSRDED